MRDYGLLYVRNVCKKGCYMYMESCQSMMGRESATYID